MVEKMHAQDGANPFRFELQLTEARGKIVRSEQFAEAEEAMRNYVRWSNTGFGERFGVGASVSLSDKQMELDISAVYEGKGIIQHKSWKGDGFAFFDQVERSMRQENDKLLSDTEQLPVEVLEHDRLDWAVADAVGLTKSHAGALPVWQLVFTVYGMPGFTDGSFRETFSPTRDAALAARLAGQEGIVAQRVADGHWRAQLPDGSCVSNGADEVTAQLRALVRARAGDVVAVPKMLATQTLQHDALADDVIARRVAQREQLSEHAPETSAEPAVPGFGR